VNRQIGVGDFYSGPFLSSVIGHVTRRLCNDCYG